MKFLKQLTIATTLCTTSFAITRKEFKEAAGSGSVTERLPEEEYQYPLPETREYPKDSYIRSHFEKARNKAERVCNPEYEEKHPGYLVNCAGKVFIDEFREIGKVRELAENGFFKKLHLRSDLRDLVDRLIIKEQRTSKQSFTTAAVLSSPTGLEN